jgi:hypothetical protein
LDLLSESEPEVVGASEHHVATLPELERAMLECVRHTERWRRGFDAEAFERAHSAREKAKDKAAFPWLFDDKGRRTRLDGRQAKANVAKVRARMLEGS